MKKLTKEKEEEKNETEAISKVKVEIICPCSPLINAGKWKGEMGDD